MDPEPIIAAVQKEMARHAFDTFKTGSPTVVMSGCPACQKPMQTLAKFIAHLTNEAIPISIKEAVHTSELGLKS